MDEEPDARFPVIQLLGRRHDVFVVGVDAVAAIARLAIGIGQRGKQIVDRPGRRGELLDLDFELVGLGRDRGGRLGLDRARVLLVVLARRDRRGCQRHREEKGQQRTGRMNGQDGFHSVSASNATSLYHRSAGFR